MENLVNAYLNTSYQVHLPAARLSLHVGQLPPANAIWLVKHHWLIITASNPASQQLHNHHNFVRHCLLSRHLQAAGLKYYPSFAVAGRHQPSWPVEYGWLVLSSDWQLLFKLARQFNQYAVITCRPGKPVLLCIMRARNSPFTATGHPHMEFA